MSKVLLFLLFSCILIASNAEAQRHEFYQIAQNADKILPKDDEATYGSGTQAEMNTSSYPERLDSLLNRIYKTILKDHEEDTAFIRVFKNSQRAWLKFRDAELEAIMPPSPPEEQGSIGGLCYWEYSVSITKRRIEELLMWYNGTEREGDACGTSYWSASELKETRGKRKK